MRHPCPRLCPQLRARSEEHTSELQSHSEISYAVFCLKKKKPRQRSGGCARALPPPHTVHWACAGPVLRIPSFFFFFNDTATTEIYTNLNTLSLHDALPI